MRRLRQPRLSAIRSPAALTPLPQPPHSGSRPSWPPSSATTNASAHPRTPLACRSHLLPEPPKELRDVTDEATRHNQAAYDQIAGLYAQRQAGSGRLCADLREAFAARLTPAAKLADLGCGPAFDSVSFATAGHRVTGIDRSAGMLDRKSTR